MAGILLNWKRVNDDDRKRPEQDPSKAVFWWDELGDESALTSSGKTVYRRWSVYNTKRIQFGSRVFLIAQGGISDGIVASGFAAQPPNGKTPIREDSVVYLDSNWKTGEPSNYIMVEFDTILEVRSYRKHALATDNLMHADLAMMHWNTERPGIEIKPKPEFHSNANLLPQLELLWQRNLERIGFPLVSDDEAESALMEVFGYEGRVRVRTHKTRERSPQLAKAKKDEALKRYGKLVCEICEFVFTARYGDHGSGFMECHHRQPLSKIADIDCSKVTLDDLALVCANCHRMLHRKDWPSVEELRSRLQ